VQLPARIVANHFVHEDDEVRARVSIADAAP
jgi:hypothetical protein